MKVQKAAAAAARKEAERKEASLTKQLEDAEKALELQQHEAEVAEIKKYNAEQREKFNEEMEYCSLVAVERSVDIQFDIQ